MEIELVVLHLSFLESRWETGRSCLPLDLFAGYSDSPGEGFSIARMSIGCFYTEYFGSAIEKALRFIVESLGVSWSPFRRRVKDI